MRVQVVGDQGNKKGCQTPQKDRQHQPESMGWCQLGLDGTEQCCGATCSRAGVLEHQMCGTAEVGGSTNDELAWRVGDLQQLHCQQAQRHAQCS